jgi:hypothetical protein
MSIKGDYLLEAEEMKRKKSNGIEFHEAQNQEEQLVNLAPAMEALETPLTTPDENFVEETDQIFPGGPSQAMVDEWKDLYKEVYANRINDTVYIWRTITRKEYKDIMRAKGGDGYYREEKVSGKCVLWPKDFESTVMNSGKAGVPTILAAQILEKSAFTDNVSDAERL